MQPRSYSDDWDFLVRKTRRHPLLYERPTLTRTADRIEIRQSPRRWLGIILMVFVVETTDNLPFPFRLWPLTVVGLFTALLAFAGLYCITQRSSITWEQGSPNLCIHFGRMTSSRNISLPINELHARLHASAYP